MSRERLAGPAERLRVRGVFATGPPYVGTCGSPAASQRYRGRPVTSITAPSIVTAMAAHIGHTTHALTTATARRSISIAIRIGPGVAIPVVFLSPGVLNA